MTPLSLRVAGRQPSRHLSHTKHPKCFSLFSPPWRGWGGYNVLQNIFIARPVKNFLGLPMRSFTVRRSPYFISPFATYSANALRLTPKASYASFVLYFAVSATCGSIAVTITLFSFLLKEAGSIPQKTTNFLHSHSWNCVDIHSSFCVGIKLSLKNCLLT